MKKIILSFVLFGQFSIAAQFDGSISDWINKKETFPKAEESFKKTLNSLKEKFVNKNVSEELLYRAAVEGMLAALNEHQNEDQWNALLTPRAVQDMNVEMTGKLVGIGVTLEFDESTGNAKIRAVLPGSSALKAGLQKRDQILNINGQRYKSLPELVASIRGKAGEIVNLKLLREDKILNIKVPRAAVEIPLYESYFLDNSTGYLIISGFTNDAPEIIKNKLTLFQNKKLERLIVDLRGNRGGIFEKLIEVANLFLNEGQIIVKTKTRDADVKEYKAKSSSWSSQTKILVLVDAETSSSAEVLAASLKENRNAILVGTKTAGKWTVESVEKLPNDYSIKYSVLKVESANGKNYEGVGLTPALEIEKKETGNHIDIATETDMRIKIEKDPILKAAMQLK